MSDRAAAQTAKRSLTARLSDVPGVVGVGLARRNTDYVVKVDLADAESARQVPSAVDGVRVVTQVVGTVHAL